MKVLGIQTADFSVSYDMVQLLRAREIPFVQLAPGEHPPPEVAVVVTTAEELPGIRHPHAVAFTTPDETLAEAQRLVHGPGPFRQCVIGVDPGNRPGIAVLGDGKVMRLVHAPTPESVAPIVQGILATTPATRFVLRIGNGAPTCRDRILQGVAAFDVRLELVDERRSTPVSYHGNAERDTAAATAIALQVGTPVRPRDLRPAAPTDGELRDIQRKSRITSQGAVTIPRALARHVALGRLTLDEAIDRMRQKA